MDPELPVLYSFRRCPYAMRARLALSISRQRYELREVMLRDKPPEMLSISPKGTVPVLVLPNGKVLEESLEIMLWTLRQNDPEHWLAPKQASMSDMQALITASDGPFKQHLDRYKYPNRYPQESAGDLQGFAQAQRAAGAKLLSQMEPRLGKGWLCGNASCLADNAILPFVRQFAHTDKAWFVGQPWPKLVLWLERFEASALYRGVMGKQAFWNSV